MEKLDLALRDADAWAINDHDVKHNVIDQLGDQGVKGFDQVPKGSHVAHIFLHVNVAHPGACIMFLLHGDFDEMDKQEAMW